MKLVVLPILLIALTVAAYAAPAPPMIAINNETMRCMEYIGGDECMFCSAPSDWQVLGFSWDASCPDDYEWVDSYGIVTCTPSKNEFCCGAGHSGASGDCEDLVINDGLMQCAFVDDINNCTPPEGWGSYEGPEEDSWMWMCPWDYAWVDVQCLIDASRNDQRNITDPNDDLSDLDVSNVSDDISTDAPIDLQNSIQGLSSTCYFAIAAVLIIAAFIWFFVIKRKKVQ